jgi:hypothetical protein
MAGKKEAKQKAGPRGQTEKNREETESSTGTKNTSEEGGQSAAQTMVKRLKKNLEDVEQQPLAEAGVNLASEGGWDAQQQATVTAYAQSRGMQPRKMLQALVNSMEKTLRKEKGENLAGQTSSLSVNQREEAPGRPETRPNPGRGGRDLRERKADSNCVACCKDKKRGIPPKTRWKEEQKEKARSQEAQGKENRSVVIPGPGKTTVIPVTEGSETQHALREAQKSAEGPKKEDAQAPVACQCCGTGTGTRTVGTGTF